MFEDLSMGQVIHNIELNRDSGFVNYQIHQTAVNMPHHPTKETRTISIMELLLIEGPLVRKNAKNYLRPTYLPRRIDPPAQ